MFNTQALSSFSELLNQSRRIITVLPTQASDDLLAVAGSLQRSLALSELKSTLTSVDNLAESRLGIEELTQARQNLGNNDLTISFPYVEGAVDKVSYHISEDNQTFYLVIKPESGIEPLDSSQVVFDRSSVSADLIILLGVNNWDQLEHLYEVNQQFFENTPTACIHSFASSLVPLTISTEQFSSMSEGFLWIAEATGLRLDAQAATYLLSSIERETNHFQSPRVNADTFEAVAKLLRYGAVRGQLSPGTVGHSDEAHAAPPTISRQGEISPSLPSSPSQSGLNKAVVNGMSSPIVADQPISNTRSMQSNRASKSKLGANLDDQNEPLSGSKKFAKGIKKGADHNLPLQPSVSKK